MATTNPSYWKRLWCWVTSQNLTTEELAKVFNKDVKEELKLGLTSYKPFKTEAYNQLQTKYPDQTVLLSVVKTLQSYIDVDSFQSWEVLKHYLCDISYGTPASALKNVAFVDTRPTFLLPNIWKFYYSERLFLLKLLQYILENKDNDCHKYNEQFHKIVCDMGLQQTKTSLLTQYDKVLSAIPPPWKIQNDFSSDTIRTEWAESNLREQLAILQCLLLVAKDAPFTIEEFTQLFEMFRKHGFGKRQGFNDLLEEKHRVNCLNIMYMEICLFMVILDSDKIENVSGWIEKTKQLVEGELTKLQMNEEHSAMLITWMMLTLQSEEHARQFETHYQHFGATALKERVFEFFQEMIDSPVLSDKSKCALLGRRRLYALLSRLCDLFDGDGSLGSQPGIMALCGSLLAERDAAAEFWEGAGRGRGAASLWSSALEWFPLRSAPLAVLAAGLARAGKSSARNLLAELKSLPVYTEPYNPALVAVISLVSDDAVIGRDYFPAGHPQYRVDAGSRATITEQKEGTFIHFRTPYSYWDIFNSEVEKALDRKGHHQRDLKRILEKVYEGTTVLQGVLSALAEEREVPQSLVAPSEGVFDVLVRFMETDAAPLPLLVACLRVCTALVPVFPNEIHLRLINTGLLPRTLNHSLTPAQYAAGVSFDSAAMGLYLVAVEQPQGTYDLLMAYIDMLSAFLETPSTPRITYDVLLPGVTLLLREVVPAPARPAPAAAPPAAAAVRLLNALLQRDRQAEQVLRRTILHSLHYTENARELLNIVSVGNTALEQLMFAETNWTSGASLDYVVTVQRAIALLMLVLRQKSAVAAERDVTPLEQLIFAQGQDALKVVPRVAGCINHVFNKNLAVLCCRLLKKFAESFHMSLFTSLDMTAYQVRVMFLERLRDHNESVSLKVAILEFVATCVGKQPGLTEAFFKLSHATKDETDKDQAAVKKETDEDSFEGILGYMADYLGTVKADAKVLHSPLLACIMELFHALWKNNMQILVRQLRENPKFWDHITSPLFSDIQPGLRTYAQIFNVLGIELFLSRDKIEPNLKEVLETFFDTNKPHLDIWITHIYSFNGRSEEEAVDKVPSWLGLLTSWKDFTTIFCKCMPLSLNIAHKAKLVQPCMTALLHELEEMKDGRLVVMLAELYVIMLANWKDDCFDNRKGNAENIDNLLTNTAAVYECLHPRAKRAILSIGTMAISSLDYKIKANCSTAQNIIRSVTNINSMELSKLFDDIKDDTKTEPTQNGDGVNEDISPVVLSLALLEQCLDLYDETFTGLSQWFQASRFTNKLLCCLQGCLQNRRHYHTSLAALRCLTAYCRGPFSKDLLLNDIDQFLWLQLLPPKFDNNTWKVHEWWKVYVYSLDFISMMVLRHGQLFVGEAVTFVGVHLDHLVEAILLPRQLTTLPALELCAATLKLLVQLCQYESRWRRENANSINGIVRSVSACLQQCVTILLRSRRPADAPPLTDDAAAAANAQLHRTLEILHMSTLCLLAFSPDLLSLLADPALDLEHWSPLVDLDFGASSAEEHLTFGTLLTAVCLLTKGLSHSYHSEDVGGSRSPRARRRVCSCSSPADRRAVRSESLNSLSSGASVAPWLALNERLVASALEAVLTLLAVQALLFVRSEAAGTRAHALVRRELGSELSAYHDFVRARVLCAQHTRSHLARNKLGAAPLEPSSDETLRVDEARRKRNPEYDSRLPPPPPPKRASHDSMREYILRKHYLDKCAQTPTKEPPSPVSHSTPTSDKKKDAARSSKRVSWAEPTRDEDEDLDTSLEEIEPVYSNLTDVQINNDEDYFHFMSVVFLCICQMDL